jgi:beta-hydroxylase
MEAKLQELGKCLHKYNKLFESSSKIPCQELYRDISIIDEALIIRDNFEVFRDEVKEIYKNFKTIKNDMFFDSLVKNEMEWSRLYLKWNNKSDPTGKKLCPKSTALVESMSNVKNVMFSVLKPGAYILPHIGPCKGLIRLHMGLITPNSDDCFISVNGEKYSWRDGEVILLDDNYPHYVKNNTDKYRVILFCDIVRPMGDDGVKILERLLEKFAELIYRES